MLDIKFIRENSDIVKSAVAKKRLAVDVDQLIALDVDRLAIMTEIEGMRARQNEVSQKMPTAEADEKATLLAEMKELKEKMQGQEEKLKTIMIDWRRLMLAVPNIPDISVPDGDDDSQNEEVKKVGEPTSFSFAPKTHYDLLTDLGLLDLDRGTKLAGFRGYVLKGDAVRLNLAIWQLAIDLLHKKNFEPFLAPALVRKENFLGTGYLPDGEEDLYKTQDEDYLAGTAEVPVMGYFSDEIIPTENLPKLYAGFSPCFRREAGSHGKDTKGLIRVHEFYKVEQVILCEASHEESVKWHEALLENAEQMMQALGLPYHVVVNCSGDLGLGQVKKYDIEGWMPSEDKYRETHSISYFHDFQTRRLNIRYKDAEGKTRFVHSLNGTMTASPRILAVLVENYQTEDGSIVIPEILRPYMGGQEKISPKL